MAITKTNSSKKNTDAHQTTFLSLDKNPCGVPRCSLSKKMNKKGMLKTLEAIIASLLLLSFVAFIIPANVERSTSDYVGVLQKVAVNDSFRVCAINQNSTCVNSVIQKYIPEKYSSSYTVLLTTDKNEIANNLPTTKTYTENIFLGTDGINIKNVIIRLYYWENN